MTKGNSISSSVVSGGLLILVCTIGSLLIGCDDGQQTTESNDSAEASQPDAKKLPKLSLHRPENCDAAVSRMNELVAAMVSDGPFPPPLKYKVREVIHGTGAAAHSHYYRIGEDGKQIGEDEDDGHDHMESAEKQHEIEVEPFTEMIDIAQWLPHIAADADINEATWNEVKSTSKQIVDVLRLVEKEKSDDTKRELFRTKADQLKEWMGKLESSLGTTVQGSGSEKVE